MASQSSANCSTTASCSHSIEPLIHIMIPRLVVVIDCLCAGIQYEFQIAVVVVLFGGNKLTPA